MVEIYIGVMIVLFVEFHVDGVKVVVLLIVSMGMNIMGLMVG
jgi:hypothetical protein